MGYRYGISQNKLTKFLNYEEGAKKEMAMFIEKNVVACMYKIQERFLCVYVSRIYTRKNRDLL